jgi:hypothetical protein
VEAAALIRGMKGNAPATLFPLRVDVAYDQSLTEDVSDPVVTVFGRFRVEIAITAFRDFLFQILKRQAGSEASRPPRWR